MLQNQAPQLSAIRRVFIALQSQPSKKRGQDSGQGGSRANPTKFALLRILVPRSKNRVQVHANARKRHQIPSETFLTLRSLSPSPFFPPYNRSTATVILRRAAEGSLPSFLLSQEKKASVVLGDVKIGFLVPLNDDCEENEGVLKIPIFEGLNVIGRSDLSVSDKQVSRKHISLTAKVDGCIEVVVEGPNPIIVNSGHQRTKICSKDKALIAHGDILQLIPGRLNFKLITLGSKYHTSPSMINASISNEGDKLAKEENMRLKRKWQDVEDRALGQTFQDEQGDNNNSLLRPVKEQETLSQLSTAVGSHDIQQAIREFRVDKNLEPLTFRLLRVQGLPGWANTSSISIENVIEVVLHSSVLSLLAKGNVIVAILSNYMVDMDWLLSGLANLSLTAFMERMKSDLGVDKMVLEMEKIPHGLIIHGESDGRAEHIKKIKPASWVLHRPPLPISYGTHHSKAMLLMYPQGVRVVVHTANLIYVDWNNKTQGLWMQDFPWKDQKNLSSSSPFENDLIEYFTALKLPEVNVNLPALGNAKINASFFRRFDYSSASKPGKV
ncbi:hypothetical protein ACLOJK_039563 [Asimina triloba]